MSISVWVTGTYAQVFRFWNDEVPDELFLHLQMSEVLVDVVHGPDLVLLELDEVLHPDDLVQLVFEADLHGHQLVEVLLLQRPEFPVQLRELRFEVFLQRIEGGVALVDLHLDLCQTGLPNCSTGLSWL